MKDPYDTLFAVKFTVDYEPMRAIEVPRAVLEQHYSHGSRISWTRRLEFDPGTLRIPAEALLA